MMRTAAIGLLCLLALVPTAAFADSLDSITPASFFQFDIEQFATLSGVNLLGSVSTQIVFSGPAGTFTIIGSSPASNSLSTPIPDPILAVTGTYSVTVLANDGTGTRTLGPVFFTVIARVVTLQPPLLFVPEAVVAEATGPSGAIVTFTVTGFSFVDPAPAITCTPASGSLFPPGLTSVSCTATDSSNLSTTASFRVNVTDTVPPVVNVPANIVSGSPTVSFTVTATDVVDGAIPANHITCTPSSGSQFPAGTTTVVCRAFDAHNNFGTASFRVTVTGGVNAPVLTVPGDILAEATSSAGATVPFVVTATDNATIVCTPASGSTFALGVTNVSCSATSPGGTSTDGFTVTVVDTMPPVLTLPNTITATATIPAGATVTYTATANDLVDGSVAISCDHPSGSTFPIGTTTVFCFAFDVRLNGAINSFSVIVTDADTTPPVLSLPANITAEATSASGAVITFTATANDAVDGPVPVNCDHASGATFPIGTTTVQCTATDAHNNTGSGSFLITVRDTTPPVLSLPANITAEATSASGAAVTYTATSTDIVDGSVPVICDHASGSTFPLGTTLVQCTATDAHNNTAHGSFSVLVQDTTAPHIVSIVASPNILWPPNHKMVDITVSVIATDAVDPAPMSQIISVSSNQPINGNGDGNTSPDWLITGPLTLQLRAERAGGADRIYTITIATTDASGNTSNGTVTVIVSNQRSRAVH